MSNGTRSRLEFSNFNEAVKLPSQNIVDSIKNPKSGERSGVRILERAFTCKAKLI